MKKLISIISLVLVFVLAFSGCINSIDLSIDENSNIEITETIKLNENEYNDLFTSLESSLGDYYSLFNFDFEDLKSSFTTEDIGGKTYYVAQETSDSFTFDDLNNDYSLDEDSNISLLQILFPARNITDKDILLGCSSASIIATHLKEAELKINVTFPTEIKVTNGELSNNNKTVTFDVAKRNTNWYAAVEGSTAPWALKTTANEQKKLADNMANNFISDVPSIYNDYLYNNTTASLEWAECGNATEYDIYKKSNNGEWKLYKTTTKTQLNVQVKPGSSTVFTVYAKNKYWTSKYYDWNTAEFTPMNTKTTPAIKKLKVSGKKVVITPKTVKYADGYIVYMSKTNKSGSFKKIGTISSYQTSFSKKLSKGKYYFKVKAYQYTATKTAYSTKASSAKKVTIK